jgi:hypothetical protein
MLCSRGAGTVPAMVQVELMPVQTSALLHVGRCHSTSVTDSSFPGRFVCQPQQLVTLQSIEQADSLKPMCGRA